MFKKIAVLGAGNGGLATAADLALKGLEVNLFQLPEFKNTIEPIIQKGGITVEGEIEGFAKIKKITTNIEEATKNVDLIIIAIPLLALDKFTEVCGPYLKDNQVVVLNMANTFGALRFYNKLITIGVKAKIKLAELSSLTYACRISKPGTVKILLKAKNIVFSAFPSKDNEVIFNDFKMLYPSIIEGKNVLETTLNNGNPISHPAVCILNAGRIEYAKGEYYHYLEGITPSVARVIKAMDDERLKLCHYFKLKEIPVEERLLRIGYFSKRENNNLYQYYHTSKIFSKIKGPASLSERYLMEDMPYGLVPWIKLANNFNIKMPIAEAVVAIGSSLMGINFFKEGISIKDIGLEKMSVEQINKYLWSGIKE
jgi:opine dehydrogenase